MHERRRLHRHANFGLQKGSPVVMRRVHPKRGVCIIFFTICLIVGLFLVSPLLLSRAPILEITDAPREEADDCAAENAAQDPAQINAEENINTEQFNSNSAVSCPNPGLVSDVISDTTEDWATFSKKLKSYKAFHAKKLQQLKNGDGSVKTLTWACSQSKCTGLGDQLLRMQFFFLLAMMSDRIFTVYWDEGIKRSSKYLLPNEIDWSYFDQNKGMCSDDKAVFSGHNCAKITFDATSMWGFGWNSKEFADFGDVLFGSEQHITVTGWVKVYTMYIGNDSIFDPGEKIKAGFENLGLWKLLTMDSENTVHCGHKHFWYHLLHKLGAHRIMEIPKISSGKVLASEPWLQVSHVIFCYMFKFPQVLVTEVDKVMKWLGINNKEYLALHLRTGFKGMPYEESAATRWIHRNWKMFDDESTWGYILDYSFNLALQRIGPNSIIYLSTDTDIAKERFVIKYHGRLKVMNTSATHSAFVRSKCEGQSENSPKSTDQFSPNDPYISMWIDFFLLARAHVVVHGESSFSLAACFLTPVAHLNQVWYMHDDSRNCIASYIGSNSTCIT